MRRLAIWCLVLTASGCTVVGPSALRQSRLRYNETIKTTSEEEMLLNIVRLRYTDTPSSLAVSNIAAQFELAASLGANPFFAAGADRPFTSVLPQASIGGADRPTFSLTPLDDSEFARRLFTPLSLEGVIYLAKTTWPIQTVFRLYLENLNWVPNSQTASGPTPALAPPASEFLEGMQALQRLQQTGDIVFGSDDSKQTIGGAVSAPTADNAIAAAQQGLEVNQQPDKTWRLQRPGRQFVLHVNPAVLDSADMKTLRRIFKLKRASHFDVTVEQLEPFAELGPEGFAQVDLETRSLLQALFFVAHGVEVPADHLERGLARRTRRPDGTPFDWEPVLRGLFKVKSAPGDCGDEAAQVAVNYSGHCFFIEATDAETKSTFALLMELARLEVPAGQSSRAPILTIPLGGR